MRRIIICDINAEFIETFKKVKTSDKIDITTYHGDVQDLIRTCPAETTAFVSPANSYLWYDGDNIDGIYAMMFPQLQRDIHHKIRESPYHHNNDPDAKPMLPIGAALILRLEHVPVDPEYPPGFYYLVAAPTMVTPRRIAGKRHPYWATFAALCVVAKHNKDAEQKIETIVIPGMGTGVGEMEPLKSMTLINWAIFDYFTGAQRVADELPDSPDIYLDNPCNLNITKIVSDEE